MASKKPTNKVGASALSGALSVILVYFYDQLVDPDLPAAVASAITVVIMFIVGYFVSDGGDDSEDDAGL